jgi:hypothetical protein
MSLSNKAKELYSFPVWKYHKNLIVIFGKEFTPPTQTARIIFIFSSVAYNIQSFFYPIRLVDNFPLPAEYNIRLQSAADFETLLKIAFSHLLSQYSKTIKSEPVYISPGNDQLKSAASVVRNYLDTRFSDGWNNSDPFALPNGASFIKINAPQNLTTELAQPLKWTPIQNTSPFGANWSKVRGVIPVDSRNKILAKFYDEIYPNTVKVPILERAKHVLHVSENLDDEQKMCAELWEGSVLTPPAINYALLTSLLAASPNTPLCKASQIYLLFGIGVFEASIIAWDIKFRILEPRPLQTVRMYFAEQSLNYHYGNIKCKLWCPYQKIASMTPPFPDTISGHSCFSSVSASIMAHFFGKSIPKGVPILPEFLPLISPILQKNHSTQTPTFLDYIPIHKYSSTICNMCPTKNVVFRYTTWMDIAEHAGISRIYGGIHYQSSNVDSQYVGRMLAREIIKEYEK